MPAEPQPAQLERILALRPTSAASRLGDSPLPLLNPRDLARALEGGSAPLVCVPVAAVDAIPGLLRAARDEDAVLGLAAPYRPNQRDAADAFFDAVRAAADECSHRRPVFLQAGPIRLTSADPRELQLRADDVYRFVDAGFSLLSVDASTLVPEAGVLVAAELLQAAAERELSVEIAAPVDQSGRAEPEALEACLQGFAARKVTVQFVRVPSAQPALVEVAGRFGAWLSMQSPGAGFRKLDVGGPFTRLVLGALDPELRASLEVRAKATGVPPWELLAQFGDPLQDAPPRAREKVEALSYAEALDLLERAGARGSASAAMAFLAEKAGY